MRLLKPRTLVVVGAIALTGAWIAKNPAMEQGVNYPNFPKIANCTDEFMASDLNSDSKSTLSQCVRGNMYEYKKWSYEINAFQEKGGIETITQKVGRIGINEKISGQNAEIKKIVELIKG